ADPLDQHELQLLEPAARELRAGKGAAPVGRRELIRPVLVPGRERRVDAGQPEQVVGVPGLDGGGGHRSSAGWINSGPSLRADDTRGPTGYISSRSFASECRQASTAAASVTAGSSHKPSSSGSRMTGIRRWIGATTSLAAVVMMAHVSCASGPSTCSPAKPNSSPSVSRRY